MHRFIGNRKPGDSLELHATNDLKMMPTIDETLMCPSTGVEFLTERHITMGASMIEFLFGALIFLIVIGAFIAAPWTCMILCLRVRRQQNEMTHTLASILEQLRALRKQHTSQVKQTSESQEQENATIMVKPASPPLAAAKETSAKTEGLSSGSPVPPPVPPPLTASSFRLAQDDREQESEEVISKPSEPGRFEAAARRILEKIWNWIIVGEEYRRPGVSTEYAVATNWLVRIGVVIVVIGVLFFLDYTSTRGWLGAMGKVSITLLTGSILLGGGIRLLGRRYHLIGQGLLGAGLAVWYAGLFAAANLYGLIGTGSAFVLMACVTLGAGFMAVRFNSLLVAILGLIGGYGTPVMLSTEAVNVPGFFGYMLVLGCGVFGIAHRRNWHLLNALSFVATYSLASLSLYDAYEPALFWHVFPFLTAFFALFSTTVFIYQLRHGKPATLIDLLMLVFNALIYFALMHRLIDKTFAMEWSAALTLGLGSFYTAHLYIFLLQRGRDRGLALGFTGLASFFLILTLPLLLSDQWLTLSWSVQAFILLWMANKLDSRFLQHTACALYMIVFVRFLYLDLGSSFYGALPEDISLMHYSRMLLSRLISFGVPVASVAAAMRLLRRPVAPVRDLHLNRSNDIKPLFTPSLGFITAGVLLFVMMFGYLHLELNRTFMFAWDPLRLPMLSILWVCATLVPLRLYAGYSHRAFLALAFLFATGLIIKLLFVDLPYWELDIDRFLYQPDYRFLDAGMRLLDFGVIISLFLYAFRLCLHGQQTNDRKTGILFGYSALALLLLYTTFEVNTCLEHFLPGMRSGGISVFWGLFALGLVTGGLVYRVRPLRLAGLAFFSFVVLKIFFSDLAQLDPLYKIIAFTLLGIVLLTGAFVYLRFEDRFRETQAERDET